MITVFGNLKGGTGKSTVAFNIAIWVATHRNKYVVVYDLDPQATISDAFEIRTEDGHVPQITPKNKIDSLGTEVGETEILVDIGLADIKATERAIAMADRLIIPVAPSQADVWSTQRFLNLVEEIRTRAGNSDQLEILGFMNRSDTHFAVRETDEAYEALQTLEKIKMIDPRLYQRTAYRRSFSEGMAVFELEKKSKAANEIYALGEVLF